MKELPTSITYARSESIDWHCSVAKNAAHRLGKGQVLMNLDADNFLDDLTTVIPRFFEAGAKILHGWSGVMPDGTYGRIALTRELFDELGGYDESFFPMGYQDSDLLNRARAMGYAVMHHRARPRCAIPNSKIESLANCRSDGATWRDFNDKNRAISKDNIEQGILKANSSGFARLSFSEVLRGEVRLSLGLKNN